MIEIIYYLSFFGILVGILMAILDSLQERAWLKTLAIIFIPFYVIPYVLKWHDDHPRKKTAVIFILGGFVVFFFVSILRLLFLSGT